MPAFNRAELGAMNPSNLDAIADGARQLLGSASTSRP